MPGLLSGSSFNAVMGLLGQLGADDPQATPETLLPPSEPPQQVESKPAEDIYSYDSGVSKRDMVKNIIPRQEMRGGFEKNPWYSTAYPPSNPKLVSTAYGPGQYTHDTLLTLDTSKMSKPLKSFYDELIIELQKSKEEKRNPGTHGEKYAYSDRTHEKKLAGTLKWGVEGPSDKEQELYYQLGEMILDSKIEIMNTRRATAAREARPRQSYVSEGEEDFYHPTRYHKPVNWNNKDIKDVHTLLGLWYGNRDRKLNDQYANEAIEKSYDDLGLEIGRFFKDIEPPPPVKPEVKSAAP